MKGILSARETHPSGEIRSELVSRLARAAGHDGMVGGQMIDMEAGQSRFDFGQIVVLQRMKTGALFEFCCESAAVLAGAGPDDQERLRNYARDIGLLFQITDDLLDALGTTESAGKKTGKDASQGKATKLAEACAAHVEPYGERGVNLGRLAGYLLFRDS